MKTNTRFSSGVLSAHWALVGAIVALGALQASPSRASGLEQGTTGLMTRKVFLLKAGSQYTISTQNLSAGGDTILHVMSDPEGNFIAGNDDNDTPGIDGGPGIHRVSSLVTIAAATTNRTVYIVVRGKPGTPQGTGELKIVQTPSSGAPTTTVFPITYSEGFIRSVSSLAAATHITTVEVNNGTPDTMLMVVGADPARTLGFDDDDGIDEMSFVRLAAACSGGCQMIVGTPELRVKVFGFNLSVPAGPVRLVWDEAIEVSDGDHDGLSNAMETDVLHTKPGTGDSDEDGISDGFEVYGGVRIFGKTVVPGGDKNGNLLKFPKYGADPNVKDVFVEVDWLPSCPNNDATCTFNIKDQKHPVGANLMVAATAISNVARVHFDAAIPTAAGDANITFGDWGGANMYSDGQTSFSNKNPTTNVYTVRASQNSTLGYHYDDCWIGAVPARIGSFHHLIISDQRPLGWEPTFGTTFWASAACAWVASDGGTMAHEMGHNFNLRHGGFNNAADGNINCKMNYSSIMSYPNQFTNGFTNGYSQGFIGIVNGVRMSEANGLGISTRSRLEEFNAGNLGRGLIGPMGSISIDWNMDGIIQAGPVRAPVNWATTVCGAPYARGSWNASSGYGVAFQDLDIAAATAAKPRMWVVGPVESGSETSIATGECDASSSARCLNWVSRVKSDVAGTFRVNSSLAVAGPLVVYRSQFNHPAVVDSSSPSWHQAYPLGGPAIVGDPSAVEVNGKVKVYFVTQAGALLRWEYDEATRTWSEAIPELWEPVAAAAPAPVRANLGITAIHGAVRPGGAGIFAAIPNRDLGTAGQPTPIEIARLNMTTVTTTVTIPVRFAPRLGGTVPSFSFKIPVARDRWQHMSPGVLPAGTAAPAVEFTKPGLAYAPFDNAVPNDGRFYMTWVPGPIGGDRTARIAFTEGNDMNAAATGRRWLWKRGQETPFADDKTTSRDSTFGGVPLARFGQSVVGATFIAGTSFFPNADGIYDLDAHDFPDTTLVRKNLGCSAHGDQCDESP